MAYEDQIKKAMETTPASSALSGMSSVVARDPGQLQEAGAYKSTLSPVIDQYVKNVANRKEFTYDPDNDAAYQAYAKKYTRLGNNAREDTLADVAGNTGGLASSFAVSAAAQAQNDYNQQLTDVIPQLMQAAYDRYNADRNYDLSAMGALQGIDDSRFNQFDANRTYGLNAWQAKQNAYMDALGYNLDLAKGKDDYSQFLANYMLDKGNLGTQYNQLLESIRSDKENEKLERRSLKETGRHNRATEKIDRYSAKTNRLSLSAKK